MSVDISEFLRGNRDGRAEVISKLKAWIDRASWQTDRGVTVVSVDELVAELSRLTPTDSTDRRGRG